MAQMLEDLKLSPELSVLEVGAGTGYNAALLAHAVEPGTVISVDVDKEVLALAQENLAAFPGRTIQFVHADGRNRLAEVPSFDRIMVTAATPDLEPAWLDQLADRGLLLAPLALAPGLAYIVRGTVTDGIFHGRLTRAAYFMPLRSEDEAAGPETPSSFPAADIRKMAAPWANWFDRRRIRMNWLGFSQALAFYGHLRGLSVHYRVLDNNSPSFGVSEKDQLCWFGQQEWHVSGNEGRDLGWTLWRAFLDAGGPWPTEFRLKASPDLSISSGRREKYIRHGPRCRHLWELMEPRDRIAWI